MSATHKGAIGHVVVAIMSPCVRFRREAPAVQLRVLIEERDGVIEDLPAKSFAESGTNVNTIILTLEKA